MDKLEWLFSECEKIDSLEGEEKYNKIIHALSKLSVDDVVIIVYALTRSSEQDLHVDIKGVKTFVQVILKRYMELGLETSINKVCH